MSRSGWSFGTLWRLERTDRAGWPEHNETISRPAGRPAGQPSKVMKARFSREMCSKNISYISSSSFHRGPQECAPGTRNGIRLICGNDISFCPDGRCTEPWAGWLVVRPPSWCLFCYEIEFCLSFPFVGQLRLRWMLDAGPATAATAAASKTCF